MEALTKVQKGGGAIRHQSTFVNTRVLLFPVCHPHCECTFLPVQQLLSVGVRLAMLPRMIEARCFDHPWQAPLCLLSTISEPQMQLQLGNEAPNR